jgi:ribonuclease D
MTSLPPAIYIQNQTEFNRLVEALAGESLLAIDTESNSLHAYRERVCLIQLSTRADDYIIDPLAIDDMSPLGRLIADENIEKVFHAAEYDIMCMKRDFGYEFANLFDTMLAARALGYRSVGLNKMLLDLLGVKVDKSHQRDNWKQRPLPEGSLRYAQMDTHYLLPLRDILNAQLRERELLPEACETFDEVCALPAAEVRKLDTTGFWKIGQPNGLTNGEMRVLRELYMLRDRVARKRDLPAFKVFGNMTMVEIARAAPGDLHELGGLHGMTPAQIRRYGRAILRAVKRGRGGRRIAPPPPPRRPDPVIAERYSALHAWRKERANKRGVESDVIVSKQTLWDLAHKAPSSLDDLQAIQGLGPWRQQTYGEEILNVLDDTR